MKVRLLAIALVGCLGSEAVAQERMAAVTYTVSFPGSNMEQFIDETSFRGAEALVRVAPWKQKSILVGVTMGWEVFSLETSQPLEIKNGTVSGKQRRYVNAVPMLVTMQYTIGGIDSWRAFAGIGAGIIYTLQTFSLGVRTVDQGIWQLGLAPEAGFQYPFTSGVDFYASGRYNYAFEDEDSLNGEPIAWNYWSVNVGLAWTNW